MPASKMRQAFLLKILFTKKPPQTRWLKNQSNYKLWTLSYRFGLFSPSLCGILNK